MGVSEILNECCCAVTVNRGGRRCTRHRLASEERFVPRPLVQHPHALTDCQPDARPVLVGLLEDAACLVEVVAGIEQQHDSQAVLAPLLDLVEVAAVGVVRVVGFLVGPVAHPALRVQRLAPQSSSASRFTAGAAGFLILSQWSDRPER